MTALIDRMQTIEVDEPQNAGLLQAFGLRWRADEGVSYTTLEEGLAQGLLEVTEQSEGGSVPTLKVRNKGDTLAFLMAGEQLCGGKQNRVLNASILVAGGAEIPIPVSCVEAGRWAYRSASFGSSGTSSHGRLRKLMSKHAAESYRATGRPSSRQGEVWEEVDRKLTEVGSSSDTRLLNQAYEDTMDRLRDITDGLSAPEGASGVVFAARGRILGMDLFDRPATLARLWPKLVRAYAIDVPFGQEADAAPVARAAVAGWLASFREAKAEAFPSPGCGSDVRLQGPRVTAAGLLLDDHPIHVEAFPEEAEEAAAS